MTKNILVTVTFTYPKIQQRVSYNFKLKNFKVKMKKNKITGINLNGKCKRLNVCSTDFFGLLFGGVSTVK